METIYGIQADTETLREAHEHQKRMQMQSRLQEQQSTLGPTKASAVKAVQPKSGLSMLKTTPSSQSSTSLSGTSSTSAVPSSTSKQGFTGRSTSTSALPLQQQQQHHPFPPQSGLSSGQSSPTKISANSSTTTSPFLTAIDYHHQLAHQHAPGQLRSTTQSPAFLAKFYENGHSEVGAHSPGRLPGSMGPVPWLSLPGAVAGPSSGGTEHSSSNSTGGLFGRRRSDVGLPSISTKVSGRSTPAHHTTTALTPTLDALHLYHHPDTPTPQQQQHLAHQHLLSHQEWAALSRNSSPMPSLNEALPRYLRKKSVDSVNPMERSFSSPGFHGSATPFMSPMPSTAGNSSSGAGGHSLFTFPAKTSAPSHTGTSSPAPALSRSEMERASSAGVLPMNRPGWKGSLTSHYHHQQPTSPSHSGYHPHLGLNTAASASVGCLSLSGSSGPPAPTTASIFRTGTPLISTPSSLGAGHGASSSSKLHHPFGSSNDRDLSSKEVHA